VTEKRKGSSAKPARKVVADKEGSSNQLSDHKNQSRDMGKLASPTTLHPPVVATRGVSSNSSTSATRSKAETTANDGKTTQSHSTRGKATAKQSTKGHRSNHTPLDPIQRDPSPSSSVGSSANEYNFSTSKPDSSWRNIYASTPGAATSPTSSVPSGNSSTNQKPLSYEDKDEYLWTSQESDWGAEADLEEQLLLSSSTDDDKINYSKLMVVSAGNQAWQLWMLYLN
jgi:hypothetical protein